MLSSISLNSIELRNGTAPGLGSPQVYLGRKNHHPMFAKRVYLLALMALIGQRAAFPQAAGEGLWPAWDAKLLEDHLQRNSANLEPGFASALAGDSLRMGVVLLNGQCTGTFISSSGLFITNHHCVMEGVAKSDRRGENWIKGGFWAKDRAGERKLENMEACVLLGTKDVTLELKGGDLERRMAALEAEMAGNSGQRVVIKSFDEGQKLIAFTYSIFQDLRLVGIPPESVARLGGEESYGKWPMAAADFALIRVYSPEKGKSNSFIPYRPRHWFQPSRADRKAGIPATAIGFPGHTTMYQSSWEVRAQTNLVMPVQIRMSGAVRDVLHQQMSRSRVVEREYGSIFRALTLSGKSISVLHASLLGQDLAGQRMLEEQQWLAVANEMEKGEIQALYAGLEDLHGKFAVLQSQSVALRLLVNWSGILRTAKACEDLSLPVNGQSGQRLWAHSAKMARLQVRQHFHTDHPATDQRILAALAKATTSILAADNQPPMLLKAKRHYKGDFDRWAAHFCKVSAFASESDALALIDGLAPNATRKLERDPAYRLLQDISRWHEQQLSTGLRPWRQSWQDCSVITFVCVYVMESNIIQMQMAP